MDIKSVFRREYKPSGLEYIEMALLIACLLMHHTSWASITADGKQILQFEPFVLFGTSFTYAVYAIFVVTIAMKFIGRFTGLTLLIIVYLSTMVYGAHTYFNETKEMMDQMQAAAGLAEGFSGMFGSFAGSTVSRTGVVEQSLTMTSAYILVGCLAGLLALCLLTSWMASICSLAYEHRCKLTRGYYFDMLGYAVIIGLCLIALKMLGISAPGNISEAISASDSGIVGCLCMATILTCLTMFYINGVVVGVIELLRERPGKKMVPWCLALALAFVALFILAPLAVSLSSTSMQDKLKELIENSFVSIISFHAFLMCEFLLLVAFVTCLLRAIYYGFFYKKDLAKDEGNSENPIGAEEKILDADDELAESNEQDSFEASDDENSNKKWYYIGGGVLAALLIGGCAAYFISKSSNNGTFADKPLEEVFPKVLKVVEVKGESTYLRTGPSTDSPIAIDPMNAQDGVNYLVEKGTRLAVMEEVGEWYKLASKDKNGSETFIKKSLCHDLITGVIPVEKIYTDWANMNSECGGDVSVVRQPRGNRLVISYTHIECDADELLLGVYQDGVYLFYYSIPVTALTYEEHNSGISINKLPDESIFYEGYYGKDMIRKVKHEWGEDEVLDWAKVSEEKLAEIFSVAISEGVKNIKILTAQDMKELQNQKPEDEDTDLSGFNYTVDNDEFGLELYAELGEKKVATGIAGGAETLTIIHQGDYDEDGEKEALVFEWGGGNAVEPPYLVYYDKSTQEFKKVEGIEDVFNDSSIKVEEWNGKTSFLATIGLRRDRYIYEYHQLKQVERMIPNVGKRIATITVKQLFGDSEESEEKTANIDVNGDGQPDELTYEHNTSHAMDWGRSMLLVGINLGEQALDLSKGLGVSGSSFSFLESTTNGYPDILCDDAWLYKWSGERYESQE